MPWQPFFSYLKNLFSDHFPFKNSVNMATVFLNIFLFLGERRKKNDFFLWESKVSWSLELWEEIKGITHAHKKTCISGTNNMQSQKLNGKMIENRCGGKKGPQSASFITLWFHCQRHCHRDYLWEKQTVALSTISKQLIF